MRRLASFLLLALLVSVPAAAQTTWQIDPAHSRAMFTVRHLGISNIRGDFSGVTGTVTWDGKDVTKASVNATIDVNSVTTRVAPRDNHLKTADFFDVESHPTMTFVSTSITPAGDGKYKMTGNLTLRGVTKPVTFDLESPAGPITDPNSGATRMGAAASGSINRKDFGVDYHQVLDGGVLGVGDVIQIQLDVELIRQGN
jgi:polyisoprenoid-binding protein YceI